MNIIREPDHHMENMVGTLDQLYSIIDATRSKLKKLEVKG
jgi:hypothetical protein